MILGLIFDQEIQDAADLNNFYVILLSCVMASAMGVHNVAAKDAVTNCPPTTVMTSTMINVASNFSSMILYYLASKGVISSKEKVSDVDGSLKAFAEKYADFSSKFVTTVQPLLWFIIGSLVGAGVAFHGTFWFGVIPILIVLMIIADAIFTIHHSHTTHVHEPLPVSVAAPNDGDIELKVATIP